LPGDKIILFFFFFYSIRTRAKRLTEKPKGKKRTVGTTILVKMKSRRGRQRVRMMRNNVEGDLCSEEEDGEEEEAEEYYRKTGDSGLSEKQKVVKIRNFIKQQ
jgi:hypothetical protein